jgi:hypothetical protein
VLYIKLSDCIHLEAWETSQIDIHVDHYSFLRFPSSVLCNGRIVMSVSKPPCLTKWASLLSCALETLGYLLSWQWLIALLLHNLARQNSLWYTFFEIGYDRRLQNLHVGYRQFSIILWQHSTLHNFHNSVIILKQHKSESAHYLPEIETCVD